MDWLDGLVCFGLFVLAVWLLFGHMYGEVGGGYARVFRRMARNPRFGLLALLEFLAVFAVTFSILRWGGVLEDPRGEIVAVGLIALALAVGVIALIHLVIGDVSELFARRAKREEPGSGDPWEDPSAKPRLQIDPPPESHEAPPPGNDDDRRAE